MFLPLNQTQDITLSQQKLIWAICIHDVGHVDTHSAKPERSGLDIVLWKLRQLCLILLGRCPQEKSEAQSLGSSTYWEEQIGLENPLYETQNFYLQGNVIASSKSNYPLIVFVFKLLSKP